MQFIRMEDFVRKYLDNKSDFYKINLKYYEYDDKESAIKNSNRIYDYSNPYKFKIYIYTDHFLTFDENKKCDQNDFKMNMYKMYIVYHELGHLIYNLNHPEYAKMCNDYSQKAKKEGYNTMILNDDEEKWVSDIAEDFFTANDMKILKGI